MYVTIESFSDNVQINCHCPDDLTGTEYVRFTIRGKDKEKFMSLIDSQKVEQDEKPADTLCRLLGFPSSVSSIKGYLDSKSIAYQVAYFENKM